MQAVCVNTYIFENNSLKLYTMENKTTAYTTILRKALAVVLAAVLLLNNWLPLSA